MKAPRKETVGECLAYWLGILPTWLRMMTHNTDGILHVLDIIKFRPMGPNLLPADHPWITGLAPENGEPIWPHNIVYASPRSPDTSPGLPVVESDEQIAVKVGHFMAAMVRKSVAEPEIPWGPRRRMPHGINYLHGAVHYNAGLLLFDDFADAILHFTDRRFRAEIRRFARETRREILLIFRDRHYDCTEFGHFAGFLRTVLPWFSNSNGPKRRVMWGNPAPYAVVNIITGNWKVDTYKVKNPAKLREVARPALARAEWFARADYRGTRSTVRWPEKLLARFTERRVKMRGERENLFFVDRRKLLKRYTAAEMAADPHA